MPAVRFVVQGRVQGVGFRWFVRNLAESMSISGEVWNRRDGGVEGIAFASDPAFLAEFGDRLWTGPGSVDAVEIWDDPDPRHLTSFEIGPTR